MSEEWCFYCDDKKPCTNDAKGNSICANCAWVETLKDAARKRQPSEKPGNGEVVLGFLESCSGKKWAEVLEYHPESYGIWLRPSIADDVDGKLVKIKWWIPIKHLLENNA